MSLPACALTPRDLNLIPFPREVSLQSGHLPVTAGLQLTVADAPAPRQAAEDLQDALGMFCGVRPAVEATPPDAWHARLCRGGTPVPACPPPPSHPEAYTLTITPAGAAISAHDAAGLTWGLQTLRQLVTANLQDGRLPCLRIRDWPALAWRGFQDDITRRRSSLLSTLEREVRVSSLLKMNYLTFYMEYQYAFARHPVIGPAGGSLLPSELRALVAYGRRYGTPIVGCQQSFGHSWGILQHPDYAALRETGDVLNPTTEATYRLLDDLYAEQIPLLDTPFFNVCCDETYGLGTGPAKTLADEIGVGGVYARHMQRVHDLVTGKYGKRMMMWGDIISQHPDHLADIPTDTIMLSWGYHAAETFEPVIMPLKNSGFDFFVCPGVNNWNRILPDYTTANTNIHHYVRDGAKLGALGMLNTSWHDDGDGLMGECWHGLAWGAECAWTGSTTPLADFDRRLGAVLFGERGGHFGRAIELLAQTHSLPGYGNMFNTRFWQGDWLDLPTDRVAATRQAEALLAIVEPALAELRAARTGARLNREQIDYTILGAERMRLMATRFLRLLEAAELYQQAAAAPQPAALDKLDRALNLVSGIRLGHKVLKAEYSRLWLLENRPFALDAVTNRFDSFIAQYDEVEQGLRQAIAEVTAGRPLPAAATCRLQIIERGIRATRPAAVEPTPLQPDAPWAVPGSRQRLGLTVAITGEPRRDQPVEVDAPAAVKGPVTLIELAPDGSQHPLPAQLDAGRLAFILPGALVEGQPRRLLLYLGGRPPFQPSAASSNSPLPKGEAPTATAGPSTKPGEGLLGGLLSAVTCSKAPKGMLRLENSAVRLLLGPEGGHLFRWEVKALGNRDLTEPGEQDWQGFADINGVNRRSPNRLQVLAAGPALVRVRCTDATGLEKTFSLWAGMPWVEVTLNSPSPWLANYDDISVMGAGSPTPGRYLFSDGATGPLLPISSTPDCQVSAQNVYWSAKYVPGGPLLAMLTPELATRHLVGPGSGMGGPTLENAALFAHAVIYGAACPEEPAVVLDQLRRALDFRHPPAVTLYAPQAPR